MMGTLDVLSCGTDFARLPDGSGGLPTGPGGELPGARAVLRDADCIFGSQALIAACERLQIGTAHV